LKLRFCQFPPNKILSDFQNLASVIYADVLLKFFDDCYRALFTSMQKGSSIPRWSIEIML
jgi:hypothetical protein